MHVGTGGTLPERPFTGRLQAVTEPPLQGNYVDGQNLERNVTPSCLVYYHNTRGTSVYTDTVRSGTRKQKSQVGIIRRFAKLMTISLRGINRKLQTSGGAVAPFETCINIT